VIVLLIQGHPFGQIAAMSAMATAMATGAMAGGDVKVQGESTKGRGWEHEGEGEGEGETA
jgi:hypothetical protein